AAGSSWSPRYGPCFTELCPSRKTRRVRVLLPLRPAPSTRRPVWAYSPMSAPILVTSSRGGGCPASVCGSFLCMIMKRIVRLLVGPALPARSRTRRTALGPIDGPASLFVSTRQENGLHKAMLSSLHARRLRVHQD